jgi:hypothetical protein
MPRDGSPMRAGEEGDAGPARVGLQRPHALRRDAHHARQAAAASTSDGSRNAVSPAEALPAVRTYRSAGSTTSSQRETESRKLATITVNATARLSAATTPLTATAAVSRTRRARSTASSGSRRCASTGASRS